MESDNNLWMQKKCDAGSKNSWISIAASLFQGMLLQALQNLPLSRLQSRRLSSSRFRQQKTNVHHKQQNFERLGFVGSFFYRLLNIRRGSKFGIHRSVTSGSAQGPFTALMQDKGSSEIRNYPVHLQVRNWYTKTSVTEDISINHLRH